MIFTLLAVVALCAGAAMACVQCRYQPWLMRSEMEGIQRSKSKGTVSKMDDVLEHIHEVTNMHRCTDSSHFHGVDADHPTHFYNAVQQKVNLVARILGEYHPQNDESMLKTFIKETLLSDDLIFGTRIVWVGNETQTPYTPKYFASFTRTPVGSNKSYTLQERRNILLKEVPWMVEKNSISTRGVKVVGKNVENDGYTYGEWTNPYFTCSLKKWLVSYTAFVYMTAKQRSKREPAERLAGVISADVDVSDMDINQCDSFWEPDINSTYHREMTAFLHTHKCHNVTSQCIFYPGNGWSRGSYKCRCRDGFYSATGNPSFNGSLVEAAWRDKKMLNSPTYDMLYVCKPCQLGCTICVDDTPCLSHYNWAFRISLLTISVMCILLTVVLACYIYRYRKLKVIKVASPIFLCITLLGCAIMYSEMAAIFPVLEVYSCVATKWTRHMGFCITYSALLLKTWRVSLTYRVKSAHKLKLTDKQLLQWLFPILLVMAIYLGTWTISSPPEGVFIEDWEGLKFKQCDFNWWDHSLAIGEFLFLLWGIRVCYNVRNAESFFNEAKHISWAIYNITIVNLIMVMIHVVILPSAGPDIKYLFGFIRTQLSTTVTITLIFGPKFYRVVKGQGDTWDNRARARGVTASFSLNGVGLVHEESTDLYQENEELKEEIQKLAAQIEFMRIVHMEVNNRHLKPKHGSFFCQYHTNQSPVTRSMYLKFESTDSPGSRISAAAELVSERV